MNKTIQSSGKRKTAIARATLSKGTGAVYIDGKSLEIFQPKLSREKIREPLRLAKHSDVDIKVSLMGGGISSQAEAARLSISRALVEHNKANKQVFLDYDRALLVADVRRKESGKPNSHGKARSKRQKSYR